MRRNVEKSTHFKRRVTSSKWKIVTFFHFPERNRETERVQSFTVSFDPIWLPGHTIAIKLPIIQIRRRSSNSRPFCNMPMDKRVIIGFERGPVIRKKSFPSVSSTPKKGKSRICPWQNMPLYVPFESPRPKVTSHTYPLLRELYGKVEIWIVSVSEKQ